MRWIGRSTKPEPASASASDDGSAATDAATASSAPRDPAQIGAELRACVLEISDGKLREDEIDPQAPLFDFGYVDSLSSVHLIETIRASYGVDVAEVDLVGRLNTLDALARHIASTIARVRR
ncbi:MAG: acyl carrier protein [Thermodesulfobacteriota bacterium]